MVQDIVSEQPVTCAGGGKYVHATDVAQAVEVLLAADEAQIIGQAFNCCERYLSNWEIAHAAQQMAETSGPISGGPKTPKHQIETGKLRALGFRFGGDAVFRETLSQLIAAAR